MKKRNFEFLEQIRNINNSDTPRRKRPDGVVAQDRASRLDCLWRIQEHSKKKVVLLQFLLADLK